MSRARLINRNKPYRTLYKTKGARYKQDGLLFTCGGICVEDIGKVEDGEPTLPQVEGYDEIIKRAEEDAARKVAKISEDAQAAATKIIEEAKAEAARLREEAAASGPARPASTTGTQTGSDLNNVSSGSDDDGNKTSTPGKLNDELAKEIRVRVDGGAEVAALAGDYGVSEESIRNVVTGKTYKNAGGPIKA